jgi:hypothetical protein
VALQQDPDCLPPHPGNQFALDRFLRYQSYGPARVALWGRSANHRDDPLALILVQQWYRAGSLLVVQRLVQTGVLVATANLTDGLGMNAEIVSHLRSRLSLVQLRERQGAENDSNWLNATVENAIQLNPVSLGKTDTNTTIGSHDPV